MGKYGKFAVALLVGTFCLMCVNQSLEEFPVPVRANDVTHVVIIGDSISTRAGLAEDAYSYPEILENTTEIKIQNFAQESYTTSEILACLEDMTIQESLADADLIIVTAGIHDIMDPFVAKANEFMGEFGFARFMDVFSANLSDYGIEDESELLYYANQLSSCAKQNRKEAAANIEEITKNLLQYENAEIIFQTVYNNINTIENYQQLSLKRRQAYNSINNPVTSVMESTFNEHLRSLAEQYENVKTVDVFSLFQGKAYQYVNLEQLDVNPNAEGHALIADAIIEAAGLEKKELPQPTTETTTTTETTDPSMTQTTTTTETTDPIVTQTTTTTETTDPIVTQTTTTTETTD
ncbi:MAG: SGNH/GDSL hydrolase family protein, partial [Oscillospiraceae bacterium]|nr:SGNH/GDSL hydrolase family protein [Oscillospiraceae bacterium]